MFNKSWPFLLHTMVGRGTPSAVQLNTTFCPFIFITVPPVLFHKAAVTKLIENISNHCTITYHIHPVQLLLHLHLLHFVLTFYTNLYVLIEHWRLLEKDGLKKETQS